jgi:hypothetical protein
VRTIYADVDYPVRAVEGFRVLELRDENGSNLTRHVDPTKFYVSTDQLAKDLSDRLRGLVHVVILVETYS